MRWLAAVLAGGGLWIGAACAQRGGDAARAGSPEQRAALAVRATYTARDLFPAAAYTWTAPSGLVYVLVDVESAVAGVVQARADLWVADDAAPARLARSDVMASAATIGAFAFQDLTGDGIPDLLGYVADSAGTAFPVFLPGARGMMVEELAAAAPGYRLSAEPERPPHVIAGPSGACALQLWAAAPAPDSQPPGWRYLALLASGRLAPPVTTPPVCP